MAGRSVSTLSRMTICIGTLAAFEGGIGRERNTEQRILCGGSLADKSYGEECDPDRLTPHRCGPSPAIPWGSFCGKVAGLNRNLSTALGVGADAGNALDRR